LANQLVFKKVKEALGLGRVRFCATAAAPISRETLDFFSGLYIPIYEIYGMSECSGPQTISIPGKHKVGSAGPAVLGVEMKIADADKDGNGEICFRGRHVFMGYLKNDKATAEAIDPEGWLHSGDIGKVDSQGFLTITGRIKELLITAGGENIPPVIIEDEIKRQLGEVISNVMVVGDRKKFLSAVITLRAKPNKDARPGEYPLSDELENQVQEIFQQALSLTISSVKQAASHPKVIDFLQAGIVRANKNAISNAQNVQKILLVAQDFTLETNELTPSLKLKRRVVMEKYNDLIEKLYAEAAGQS